MFTEFDQQCAHWWCGEINIVPFLYSHVLLLGYPVFFMRPSHRSFSNANEPFSPANATFYFLSGMAAVFMAYSIYSNVKSFRERNAVYTSRRKREVMRQEANKRVEDCTFIISYHDQYNTKTEKWYQLYLWDRWRYWRNPLMPVYKAGKLSIRDILSCKLSDALSCNRAVKIVLDRAMSGTNNLFLGNNGHVCSFFHSKKHISRSLFKLARKRVHWIHEKRLFHHCIYWLDVVRHEMLYWSTYDQRLIQSR